MMHVAEFVTAAPASRVDRCIVAIPATNLTETFKGQDSTYLLCSVTGCACKRGPGCANLILEAIHKGLAGSRAEMAGG
jgi:hypothetical protein